MFEDVCLQWFVEKLNPEAFQWFVVHGPWSTMIPWVYLSGRTANIRKGPKKEEKTNILEMD